MRFFTWIFPVCLHLHEDRLELFMRPAHARYLPLVSMEIHPPFLLFHEDSDPYRPCLYVHGMQYLVNGPRKVCGSNPFVSRPEWVIHMGPMGAFLFLRNIYLAPPLANGRFLYGCSAQRLVSVPNNAPGKRPLLAKPHYSGPNRDKQGMPRNQWS